MQMVFTSVLFYPHTCGLITGSAVTSFSNAILQNYDP